MKRSEPSHRSALVLGIVIIAISAAVAIGVIFWLVEVASGVPTGCTEIGTPGDDMIAGTERRDKICALEGDDFVHGNDGRDAILGMAGGDTLVGGAGNDRLRGGSGPDRLFAVDRGSGDVVIGGTGFDRCYLDAGERRRGCEEVHVSQASPTHNEVDTIIALSDQFLEALEIGEIAQESPGPTGPPGPPGPTGALGGPPFASCPPPVDATPQPCREGT